MPTAAMAEYIRQSFGFPVIQSVHIIGLTLLVGTVSLVDLRLLGVGLRRHAARDVAAAVAPWTSVGLLTVMLTGPLLFWSDLTRYVNNPAFLWKMGLLALALAGHFTVHRSTVRQGATPGQVRRKLAATASLLLWSSVVVAGRAIADFDI